jgi:hypothetical protein
VPTNFLLRKFVGELFFSRRCLFKVKKSKIGIKMENERNGKDEELYKPETSCMLSLPKIILLTSTKYIYHLTLR